MKLFLVFGTFFVLSSCLPEISNESYNKGISRNRPKSKNLAEDLQNSRRYINWSRMKSLCKKYIENDKEFQEVTDFLKLHSGQILDEISNLTEFRNFVQYLEKNGDDISSQTKTLRDLYEFYKATNETSENTEKPPQRNRLLKTSLPDIKSYMDLLESPNYDKFPQSDCLKCRWPEFQKYSECLLTCSKSGSCAIKDCLEKVENTCLFHCPAKNRDLSYEVLDEFDASYDGEISSDEGMERSARCAGNCCNCDCNESNNTNNSNNHSSSKRPARTDGLKGFLKENKRNIRPELMRKAYRKNEKNSRHFCRYQVFMEQPEMQNFYNKLWDLPKMKELESLMKKHDVGRDELEVYFNGYFGLEK